MGNCTPTHKIPKIRDSIEIDHGHCMHSKRIDEE